MALTPKKAMFLAEYLVDGNGTRAAIAAGFSAKTATVKASRLIREPEIAAAIDEQRARRAKRLEVSADRVTEELAAMAFVNVRDFFDRDGNLKPLHELDEETSRAIVGMDVDRVETTKMKTTGEGKDSETIARKIETITRKIKTEKLRSLELLGKKLGMFVDRSETRDLTLEQLLCGDIETGTGGSDKAA